MSQPVHGACQKPRIAQHDLLLVVSCGISLVKRFHIGVDKLPDGRDPADKGDRQLLRKILDLRFRRLCVFIAETQRDRDLLRQVVDHILDQDTDPAVIIVASVVLLPVVAGKKNVEEFIHNIRHSIAVRLAENIHLIDVSSVLVVLQYPLGDLPDPLVDQLLIRHLSVHSFRVRGAGLKTLRRYLFKHIISFLYYTWKNRTCVCPDLHM